MRFRFHGCYRETGEPVEGHVEASDTEAAYQVLSDHGIVTETLRDCPKPLNVSRDSSEVSEFDDALDSAIDSSSSQVAFDALSKKYRGKKVWVIDRDRIRDRVAQVVDLTLATSEANVESDTTLRQRVAEAIKGLFHDTQNIASQHDAASIAKLRAMIGATGPGASGIAGMTDAGLTEQIGRLNGAVEQAEGLIAAMQAALRNVESGGAPRRRVAAAAPSTDSEQSGVLREIFESNLELRRSIVKSSQPAVKAAGTS